MTLTPTGCGQAHRSQQECPHRRCAQLPLSAGGRGPDRRPRPACQYRANDSLGKWPNAKAFCSWLGLAPHHEISGGKILRRSTLKTRNRAAQAFRLAAQAVSRSHNSLGAYYRRMRARLGRKRLSWPPPTNSRASFITCSPIGLLTGIGVPRSMNSRPVSAKSLPCAQRRRSSAWHWWSHRRDRPTSIVSEQLCSPSSSSGTAGRH
jgi:Transposase IS116/IS110/IS902 family